MNAFDIWDDPLRCPVCGGSGKRPHRHDLKNIDGERKRYLVCKECCEGWHVFIIRSENLEGEEEVNYNF